MGERVCFDTMISIHLLCPNVDSQLLSLFEMLDESLESPIGADLYFRSFSTTDGTLFPLVVLEGVGIHR